tara:strand:- start:13 stop:264 length:252 start_codon:yes stop_codon:yes gene_type:complete
MEKRSRTYATPSEKLAWIFIQKYLIDQTPSSESLLVIILLRLTQDSSALGSNEVFGNAMSFLIVNTGGLNEISRPNPHEYVKR